MTKRVFFKCWLLLAMGMATVVFNSCSKEKDDKGEVVDKKDTSNPESVLINNVRWATCNVGAPGKFVAKPEDSGMFYQWNRPEAWETTGEIADWDNSISSGSIWEATNDPSPVGYRMPNKDEIYSLCDVNKVSSKWVTENGVHGRKFTDKATGESVFLPAVGYRDKEGVLSGGELFGFYWSGSLNESSDGYNLNFREDDASRGYSNRSYGLSIRCVAE
ncbi:MAG: hypothetical protein LBR52_05490 [Prevotellaceae bacterium]|jgi:uncharacterized protein (TIGR02145 family)|nr:hypothetical protein [Prevotellaceae bacterium]